MTTDVYFIIDFVINWTAVGNFSLGFSAGCIAMVCTQVWLDARKKKGGN